MPREQDKVQSFIDELPDDAPTGSILSGLVKRAPSSDSILFSHVGDGKNWVQIHKSAVRTIHRTGVSRVGGTPHTTADIELQAPASPLEQALSGIVSLQQTKLASASATFAGGAPIYCPVGTTPMQNQDGSWVCVPTGTQG